MKMPFGPKGFQEVEWPMPNMLMGNMPGFETMATSLMKETFKNKGVATIEELREKLEKKERDQNGQHQVDRHEQLKADRGPWWSDSPWVFVGFFGLLH